jgi:hypothetical protein
MCQLTLVVAFALCAAVLGGCSSLTSHAPTSPAAIPGGATAAPVETTQARTAPDVLAVQCEAGAKQEHLQDDAMADYLNGCISEQNVGGGETTEQRRPTNPAQLRCFQRPFGRRFSSC